LIKFPAYLLVSWRHIIHLVMGKRSQAMRVRELLVCWCVCDCRRLKFGSSAMIAGRTAASREHMLRRRRRFFDCARHSTAQSKPPRLLRALPIHHACVCFQYWIVEINSAAPLGASSFSLSSPWPRLLNLGALSQRERPTSAWESEWVSELLNRFFIICVYKSGARCAFIGWPLRFELRGSICIEIFIMCPHTHSPIDAEMGILSMWEICTAEH
jgi:hypothetical protein